MLNQLRYINVYGPYSEMSTTQETIIKNHINEINPEKFKNYLKAIKANILENFELEEPIGSGSESIVYKGISKKYRQFFALKMILKENQKGNQNNNKNELKILLKLKNKNKNIIQYYSTIKINDEIDCIIMEYSPLGNLRIFSKIIIPKKTLSETMLSYFSYQILNGLKYCHSCKVAHLDIKPENLVVDINLNIKLIDFSISLDYSKIKSNKIKIPLRGTCFYIAPEILSEQNLNINDINKVDLYSLGVTLYYLAFGYYPFGLNYYDNYKSLCQKVFNADLIINNEEKYFSYYFVDFLKKILEKDITKRININQALNHYWIKGADILFDENEKLYNDPSFLIKLNLNSFKEFNDYLGKGK